MKRNLLVALTAVLFALTCFSQSSYSENKEGGEDCGKPHQERMEKMINELGLTEEQVTAMKAYKEEHRENSKTQRQEMKSLRQSLKTELEKAEPDQAVIDSISTELKNAQAAMIDQRIESILGMKKILTPEQFATFQEKMGNGKGKGKGHQCQKGDGHGHDK